MSTSTMPLGDSLREVMEASDHVALQLTRR